MDNYRSGFVTIIGKPNVGKSTLLNVFAGQKIAIISNKPQTTRGNIKAIVSENDCQIIFLDTPGIHVPRYKLGEHMVDAAHSSIEDMDVALFVIDATNPKLDGTNRKIIEKFREHKTPVICVINKIDKMEKNQLLSMIDEYSKEYEFTEIVPISAYKKEGIEELLKLIKSKLPEGPKYFSDDDITDQTERQMVEELIREKALMLLENEIPHGISVEIETMKERFKKNIVDIRATIYCERKSHKSIIIGKGGLMLKKIGQLSREEIEKMLDKKIYLELWVKVKEGWRDDEKFISKIINRG